MFTLPFDHMVCQTEFLQNFKNVSDAFCVLVHTLLTIGHLKFLLFFRAADFSSCMQQLLLLISSLVFNAKTNLICLFFLFR